MSPLQAWIAQSSAARCAPADDLSAVLQRLQARLASLTACDCPTGADGMGARLDELYRFLVEELTPVLHAIHVRIRPALRRYDSAGHAQQAATDNAALLRLGEQVALLRAEHELFANSTRTRCELTGLSRRVADLAGQHLADEQRTLPPLLRQLPSGEAERLIDTARRTARAAAYAPRPDLQPAGL